jgi:hypothetical protein
VGTAGTLRIRDQLIAEGFVQDLHLVLPSSATVIKPETSVLF